MLSVDAVRIRLAALGTTVLRRVEGAADFMALRKANALPQVTPAAHVIPGGLRGGARQDTAGGYIQDYEEVVAVIITLRGNDPEGQRALAALDPIITAIIGAICGWAPVPGPGDFRLARGSVASMDAEALVYLLEFAIPRQLRSA